MTPAKLAVNTSGIPIQGRIYALHGVTDNVGQRLLKLSALTLWAMAVPHVFRMGTYWIHSKPSYRVRRR